MIFVLTTVPSQKVGRKLARLLLAEKLAACVSLSAPVESHYVWKKKYEKAREYFLWIKTRKTLRGKVGSFLKKHHPYEVPEIVFLPVAGASTSYLRWVIDSTVAR